MSPTFVLSFGVGITMIAFGINQISHPEKWLGYMPAWLTKSSPMKPETSMRIHAVGNLLFGLFLIFPLYPLVAAWIGLIWWITILPFAFKYDWKIGMRDLSIIFALIALVMMIS